MKKYGLSVTVEDDNQPKPLSEEARTVLQRSVRELLFNVLKHAGVNEARIILSRKVRQVKVTVEDQGKGFDVEKHELYPTQDGGFGLFNLREQMDLLGGRMDIVSQPDKGTQVALFAPGKHESDIPVRSEKQT